MPEPEISIQEIYVQPGESHLVSQPAVLRTVLGSCVGITFLVPRLGVGAICHPMMPNCPPAQRAAMSVRAGRRYVDFAVHDIASRLDSLGAVRGEVLVKLFGGNEVLTVNGSDSRDEQSLAHSAPVSACRNRASAAALPHTRSRKRCVRPRSRQGRTQPL